VQEGIDIVAVANALRVGRDSGRLTDYTDGKDRSG
jgi:hypothetical protein